MSPAVTAYTLGDVARICKISPARLRYWERTALLEASERIDAKPAYDFRDLVVVKSLVGLLDQGVPLRRIRCSVEALRRRMPELKQPIGALRTWVDGSDRVVVRHSGRLVEPDGQMVLDLGGPESAHPETVALPRRGRAESLEERGLRAEEHFDRGCALDSDRSTFGEAIEAYQAAIAAEPAHADAHCNLGSIYFNQGRRSPARTCFERAIEIRADHLEANLNLATLEEEAGRDAVALRYYKVALSADPLYADTHVSVALLYEKMGLRRKARGHWRRYLQLDAVGLWSEIARQRLDD
jgi:tetratricopeptide (TPR) repeat protein